MPGDLSLPGQTGRAPSGLSKVFGDQCVSAEAWIKLFHLYVLLKISVMPYDEYLAQSSNYIYSSILFLDLLVCIHV